jgi:hypothetical protein
MAQQATAPYNIQGVIIESAPLQLLVSVGVVGVILIGIFIASGIGLGLLRQDYSSVGALAAYATSASFFNILESNRPAMLFLGLGLFMAFRSPSISAAELDDTQAPQLVPASPSQASLGKPVG